MGRCVEGANSEDPGIDRKSGKVRVVMKKSKKGIVFIGIIAAAVVAYLVYDLLQLKKKYSSYKSELESSAKKHALFKKNKRKERIEQTLEKNIERFEQALEVCGAKKRGDLDEKNIDKYNLRSIYEYNGNYYRIGTLSFEEEKDPYIVVNAIDSEKFAKIGVMEEIEAYPYDMPEDRIKEVVAESLQAEL